MTNKRLALVSCLAALLLSAAAFAAAADENLGTITQTPNRPTVGQEGTFTFEGEKSVIKWCFVDDGKETCPRGAARSTRATYTFTAAGGEAKVQVAVSPRVSDWIRKDVNVQR